MRLQDLLGIYYVYDYQTRSYGQENVLEIIAKTMDKVEFVLIKKIRGPFGSSNITWKGNCKIQDNKLILMALENRVSNLATSKGINTFSFEILEENDCIILKLVQYEKTIKLTKLNKSVDRNRVHLIAHKIIQEIINQNNLMEDNLEYEPDRFWRISNLLIKSYNEIKINQQDAIEVEYVYDLEYVKEEKRVIENDEILAKYEFNKATFNFN